MAWFVLVGHDAPDAAARRQEHRPAHLKGLEALDAAGRIRHGGPLLDENDRPRGSVVVYEAADLSEAREIAARDAYVREGVFERYEVHPTRPVFPRERA